MDREWPRNHHFLKCAQPYFDAVADRTKRFEIRLNDRDYQQGDMVTLQEWSAESGYSGREEVAQIGYVTNFEQRMGYVVFSLIPIFDQTKSSGGKV